MTHEPRHFLIRWQTEFAEGEPVTLDASVGSHVKGARKGDVLWIQCVLDDRCYLLGRIVVGRAVPPRSGKPAMAYAVPSTIQRLKKVDITDLLPAWRFISKTAPRINPDNDLSWSLFSRRRLEPASAARLAIAWGDTSQPWLKRSASTEIMPTAFSFGYWGWGSKTRYLVRMVDEHEAEQGYEQPLWVDIRWNREGQAKGFHGRTFERLVGSDHYIWMRDLGNAGIAQSPPVLRIHRPRAAIHLLALAQALERARRRRRIIFYCACKYPMDLDHFACHRVKVGSLLLKQAKAIGQPLGVIEWPGGVPRAFSRKTTPVIWRKVKAGRKSVPRMGDLESLPLVVPWGTVLELESEGREPLPVVIGPAQRTKQWQYPILHMGQPGQRAEDLSKVVRHIRLAYRFEPRRSA